MSKFHINKNGVPAPCRAQKGNCPLGGAESHFETQEQAQTHADKENASEYGTLPGMEEGKQESIDTNYVGNYYTISKQTHESLSERMNEGNAKEIFDKGLSNGDIIASQERYKEDTPINFDMKISKVGDNEYEVKGTLSEHEYVEKDFDTKEEYDEYAKGKPDTTHEVNYKFTGDELKESLVKYERIGSGSGTHPSQTSAIVMSGVYHMTRNRIE